MSGYLHCILKGQGNALLYPDPYMRTPGDIDIYLSGCRRKIMKYVDQVCPNQVMRYHHVNFPVMKTAIEVHFTPSYMFFPVHNRRMQKWFKKVMDLQCSNVVTLPDGYGEITVPTMSFNVIYILSHLYRHVFTEGIGLRQLIDYYFVLVMSEERRVKNLTALQRELKYLGLWKFAGAVMYVLHEALGLPEAKMIAPIDVNEGRFLLAEIMRGGNFGQYDTRLGSKENEGKLHRYLRMSLRNLRFVKHYPTEALSEPLFRTWFAVWKKIHGIR
ncbi:MAG: nucleotidyltransferase family protein [Segatella copri]